MAAALPIEAVFRRRPTRDIDMYLLQLVYGGFKVKTAVHRDGGTSPVWNESIKL